MDILIKPYVIVTGDPEKRMVALRWTGYCPSVDYREALETARESVVRNKFIHWLADLRQMTAILQNDERWTVEEWFPKMGKAGLERMAILMSSDLFNQMSVDRIMDDSKPSYGFDVAYFGDEGDARNWLLTGERSTQPVGK